MHVCTEQSLVRTHKGCQQRRVCKRQSRKSSVLRYQVLSQFLVLHSFPSQDDSPQLELTHQLAARCPSQHSQSTCCCSFRGGLCTPPLPFASSPRLVERATAACDASPCNPAAACAPGDTAGDGAPPGAGDATRMPSSAAPLAGPCSLTAAAGYRPVSLLRNALVLASPAPDRFAAACAGDASRWLEPSGASPPVRGISSVPEPLASDTTCLARDGLNNADLVIGAMIF